MSADQVRQHIVKCMADIAYIQNEIVVVTIKITSGQARRQTSLSSVSGH